MKTIVLLICLAALAVLSSADETDVEDLGEITNRRGISLEKCKRRLDFLEFRIDFFPQTPPTNQVSIVTTNDLLLLPDLAQLPSGPVIMAVRSVCTDSAESPISFYRFDIMRSNPAAPKAKVIGVLIPESPQTATNALHRIRARKAAEAARNIPPTPGGTNVPPRQGRALPDSTPKTYGMHLDEMARYYARESRK